MTLTSNVPISNRVLELDPGTGFQEFEGLRERWDALHTIRMIPDIVGLGFSTAVALSRFGRRGMERT